MSTKSIMRVNRLGIISGFLLVLALGCSTDKSSSNRDNGSSDIELYDSDSDSRLDTEEFDIAFDGIGFFDEWDDDNDSVLDEDEWNDGIKRYYDNYELGIHGAYADWDEDMNHQINKNELSKKTFSMYDVDGDGYIENKEYERWYYGVEKQPKK